MFTQKELNLRQRGWLEMLKDISLYYHSGKANMVVDGLRRLSIQNLVYVDKGKRELVKGIHHWVNMRVRLLDSEEGGVFVQKVVQSSLCTKVKEKQVFNPILMRIKGDVGTQKVIDFEASGDGTLRYQESLCVPNIYGLRERILIKHICRLTLFILV